MWSAGFAASVQLLDGLTAVSSNTEVKTLQTALVSDHRGLVNFAGNTQKNKDNLL